MVDPEAEDQRAGGRVQIETDRTDRCCGDYCVSPSPKNWAFGFFRLGQDLGLLGHGIGTWTWS